MEFICVNKNRKVFNTSKGAVVIDIVNVPKYRIGDNEFTEYDMRHLQLQVAQNLESSLCSDLMGVL